MCVHVPDLNDRKQQSVIIQGSRVEKKKKANIAK